MKVKRLVYTALIFIVAGSALTGVAEDVSGRYAEQALTRALTTFAVARTLNGVISVAQGTEIALEPGGVGVVLTPGQVLDPVNDLIERFSSVMLVAASSLGLQIILLDILSWWVLTAVLITTLAIWLASLWYDPLGKNTHVRMLVRIALFLTILRFAVPVVIICTNLFFDTFLLTKHESAANELNASTTSISNINGEIEVATLPSDDSESEESSEIESDEESWQLPDFEELTSGLKNSAEELYSNASEWARSVNIAAPIRRLEEIAAETTSHIVDLIVIFVLQTIILPLGFLWIFVEALKALTARSLSLVSGGKNTPED